MCQGRLASRLSVLAAGSKQQEAIASLRYFDQVVWPSYQVHLENALAMARDDGRLTFLDGREEATIEKIAENVSVSLEFSIFCTTVCNCVHVAASFLFL